MALLDRLHRFDSPKAEASNAAKKKERKSDKGDRSAETTEKEVLNRHQDLKFRVHNRLFDLLDLAKLTKLSEERIREDIAVATRRVPRGAGAARRGDAARGVGAGADRAAAPGPHDL